MRLSAAKRGQLILLIVAVSSGGAGYCVGRYQAAGARKAAFASGDGYGASSAHARELYGRGHYAAAAVEAARVLAGNPSDSGAYAVLELANSKLDAARPRGEAPPLVAAAPADENVRRAQQHWNSGIIYFQAGKYDEARDEWLLCKQFDATNADCATGLARLDSTYGGGS